MLGRLIAPLTVGGAGQHPRDIHLAMVFAKGIFVTGHSLLTRGNLFRTADKSDSAVTKCQEMLHGSLRSGDVVHSHIVGLHSGYPASEKNDRDAAILYL